jgi:phenylpropionate dioxygenase-like ring-hydroxylating dioxygenase large terminal subunit/AcrR family transcriptional regulator
MAIVENRQAGASTPLPESKQRLIDATMTAIFEHGISNLTLAKITALAGLTAGTVNFHFTSKESLLLATLRSVAEEFEQAIAKCLEEAGEDPAQTLLAIVDANLDPDLTEPRKVAVWYAFMSESRARQDYQQLCGDRDAEYFRVVLQLCERMARDPQNNVRIDAEAIAYALVGLIDEIWQEIMFTGELFDRPAARRRCQAFLASVFPWRFQLPAAMSVSRDTGGAVPTKTEGLAPVSEGGLVYTLPAWVYGNDEFLALEKEHIFMPSWQLVCHVSDMPKVGNYVTFDLLNERAFVVRGEDGQIRAFHNVCRHRAHAVVQGQTGHCKTGRMVCPYHGWSYDFDGKRHGLSAPDSFRRHDASRFGLKALECEIYLGFVFVRFAAGGPSAAEQFAPYAEEFAMYRTADMVPTNDRYSDHQFWEEVVDIDWKNGVENYVEDYHFPSGHRGLFALMKTQYDRDYAGTGVIRLSHEMREKADRNWSTHLYRNLLPKYEHLPPHMQTRWTYYALFPNTFFDLFPEKMDFFQMIPLAAGRVLLRGRSYGLPDNRRETRAVRYLSDRINMRVQAEDNELTHSVQRGLGTSAYDIGILSDKECLVKSFQDWVRERLPVSTLLQAPAGGTVAFRNVSLANAGRR